MLSPIANNEVFCNDETGHEQVVAIKTELKHEMWLTEEADVLDKASQGKNLG